MPRRPISTRPVDLGAMTERITLPPPSKMPREADGALADAPLEDEHVDIDKIATERPPAPAEEADSVTYANASESLLPPTLAPPPEDGPFFHRARVGKIAMTLAALVVVGAVSHLMGRTRGRVEGELNAARTQLTTLGDSAPLHERAEPTQEPSAPTPSNLAGSLAAPPLLAPLEPPAVAMALASPTAVEATAVKPDAVELNPAPSVTPPPAREQPVSEAAERRAERRERRRAEDAARAEASATRSAAMAAMAAMAAETTSPAPSEEPSTETVSHASLPTDPLAHAVATDPAAQRTLGELASSAPSASAAPVTPSLPERPSRSAVRATLHDILPAVRRCGVGGVVKVSIAIASSGEVARARVVESDAAPDVKECIVHAVLGARFPPFSGSTLVVTYPFRL